jgi:hypothetical protein
MKDSFTGFSSWRVAALRENKQRRLKFVLQGASDMPSQGARAPAWPVTSKPLNFGYFSMRASKAELRRGGCGRMSRRSSSDECRSSCYSCRSGLYRNKL